MVVDDVQGKAQIYINGIVESDAEVTPGGLVASVQPMIVGARADIQIDKCTYGIIDDITVWNVALTPQEIAQVLDTGPMAVSPERSSSNYMGRFEKPPDSRNLAPRLARRYPEHNALKILEACTHRNNIQWI